MNNPHQDARLTVHSREQIAARIVAGRTAAEVAVTVRKRPARDRAAWRFPPPFSFRHARRTASKVALRETVEWNV